MVSGLTAAGADWWNVCVPSESLLAYYSTEKASLRLCRNFHPRIPASGHQHCGPRWDMRIQTESAVRWSCSVMVNAPVSGCFRTPRWRLQIRILPGSFFLFHSRHRLRRSRLPSSAQTDTFPSSLCFKLSLASHRPLRNCAHFYVPFRGLPGTPGEGDLHGKQAGIRWILHGS
jgi:hypothetical protein